MIAHVSVPNSGTAIARSVKITYKQVLTLFLVTGPSAMRGGPFYFGECDAAGDAAMIASISVASQQSFRPPMLRAGGNFPAFANRRTWTADIFSS